MVYKVDRRLVLLTVILLIASLFFTVSVYFSNIGRGGLIVCFIVVVFILYNLLVLISKKIEVKGTEICQTTLYGKKTVDISKIEDIGVVKLRWRVLLIISDPHKFVFISSFYEDFEGFVQYLKDNLTGYLESLLKPVSDKVIRKKRKFLITVVIGLTIFFIGSGVYNILYR
ncbi:MAG: hypothetical protein C0602_12015 [Denitrovibrio sp.]|nr:MAG: hypothetical protein C0602_12015 [Denitrovibrio sp.]